MKHGISHGRRALMLLLSLLLPLAGCTQTATNVADDLSRTTSITATDPGTAHSSEAELPAPAGMPGNANAGVTTEVTEKHADLSNRDTDDTFDMTSATQIALSGTSATIEGDGATLANGVITIASAGTYVLSGTFSGSVAVDATDTDKIQLVLNGADITCTTGPALTILQADKVFITAPNGTKNTLTDGATYTTQDEDGEPDACLFSKDDLTINGTGSLTVSGNAAHGIVTKDDLVLYGVHLSVTAATDGIKSNNGTTVSGDAVIDVVSADDAFDTKGDCIVESGTITIQAGDDGIHADMGVYINGGAVHVLSSVEGLEGLIVCQSGGTVDVVSTDDGVNATGETASSANAATDSAAALPEVPDATASASPAIADAASDAAESGSSREDFRGGMGRGDFGGGTFEVVEGAIIAVLGGKLTVSAGGDGLDSNGDLLIAGGEVYIQTEANTADSAIDYNGGCMLTGGTLVATGGASMLQSISSDDSLPILCLTADSQQPAGSAVTLTDAGGSALATFTPDRAWRTIIMHAPGMTLLGEYTVSVGNTALATVALESAWTTSGDAAGSFGGGMGGHGNRQPGDMPEGFGGKQGRPGGMAADAQAQPSPEATVQAS